MKRILFIFMLFLCFATEVAHATELEPGEVEDVKFSAKGLMRVNSDVEIGTFAIEDYKQGLQDNVPGSYIKSSTIPGSLKDNNLTTGTSLDYDIYRIDFVKKMSISAIYIYMDTIVGPNSINITTYGNDGKRLEYYAWDITSVGSKTYSLYSSDVSYMTVRFMAKSSMLNEIEIFGEPYVLYDSVSDLNAVDINYDSFGITYKNPKLSDYKETEIYLDNELLYKGKAETYKFEKLKESTEYEVKVVTVYEDGERVQALLKVKTAINTNKPSDVTDFSVSYNEIKKVNELKYTLGEHAEYVKIYRDNALIADNLSTTLYNDTDVKLGRTYNYKVVSVNKNGESTGVSASIKMPDVKLVDITNLKAVAASDRVDLSWNAPKNDEFEYVVIYRTDLSSKSLFRLFSSGEKAIFETNGTYFNDLTVKSDNKYRYRITSMAANKETEGVSIEVTTPKLQVSDGNVKEEENGDYTVTWSAPVKGEIKIYVGGKLYTTVDAATKKHTIIAKDMKYTPLGSPDVQLMPVSEDGTEGGMSQPGGTSLPPIEGIVSGNDLITVSVQLFKVIGGFLLLGLVFYIAPKFMKMIRNALAARNSNAVVIKRERRVRE